MAQINRLQNLFFNGGVINFCGLSITYLENVSNGKNIYRPFSLTHFQLQNLKIYKNHPRKNSPIIINLILQYYCPCS